MRRSSLHRNRRRVIYGLLAPLEHSLTLARMQYPAIVSNLGNGNPLLMQNSQTRATPSPPNLSRVPVGG